MSIIKVAVITALLAFATPAVQAQDTSKQKISLPDIPGYLTLKCDFHMHTVFSDGHVWPTFRVHEAVRDGLDAISLTEHIDYEGQPDDIKRNYNRSFDIATEEAKNKDLLIIRGVEISPRVPPYHNNALFIQDANKIPSPYMKNTKKKFVMKDSISHDELMAPFSEVQKQGAFVFYNHPGYSWWDKKDTNIFTSFHKELLEKKILSGVEVVNSGMYNIIAHRIAAQYHLAMVCNTDEHYDMYARYANTHRPVTLVFAKTKTAESIREALQAHRTALYFDDYLVAEKEMAEAFFKASVQVTTERKTRNGEPLLLIHLYNRSDIPYKIRATADYNIERLPMGQAILQPHDTTTIILKAIWTYPAQTPLRLEVLNVLVAPDEALHTAFQISTSAQENDLDKLPLNKVQLIGSHNSYKQPIDKPLFDILKKADSSLVRHIDYSHISLTEQLSLGLLNLEIDIYADTKGGKYTHPMGLTLEGKNARPFDEEGVMKGPGFKVFHIQDIDFRSNCLAFRNCLQELKSWSHAHADHYPVFITINAKDDSIGRPGFTVPEKFTKAIYDQLDSTLVADLGTQYLITPDMIRGQYATLEEAVLKGNWPLLKNAKGKFIFILDESPAKTKMYVDGHPGLQKRILFVNANPGTPEAAILIMNEPVKEMQLIKDRVAKGYIVRTRADADTEEARRNDKSRFEAACRSGAQIITTDYYRKSTHFSSEYSIQFEGGKYIRPNPMFK